MISDESFKELLNQLTKKDYVSIYNRCYSRLKNRGVKKEAIKGFINDEIRSELFKLLPKVETETVTDSQIKEREESQQPIQKDFVHMHGVRLWGDEPTTDDNIESLKNSYNDSVKNAFKENFCPICHCEKSVCRCHEYY